MPVKMRIFVAPRFEIPAQTCTLYGCFTFGFSLAGTPFFRKQSLLCRSNQMLDSSVKITLSNISPVSSNLSQNARRATRFGSRIAWQYFGPCFRQPSFHRNFLIAATDTFTPHSRNRSFWRPITRGSKIAQNYWSLLSSYMTTCGKPFYLRMWIFETNSWKVLAVHLPLAVSSSFSSNFWSIKSKCSCWIVGGRPLRGRSPIGVFCLKHL